MQIKDVITLKKGKKPNTISNEPTDGWLPYVDIKSFETGVVDKYTGGENCIECAYGDILIVCDGSRSGLVGKAIDGYVGSTLARIDILDSCIDKDYLYYFLQSKYVLLNKNVKGTGTPHLKQDLLKSFEIYLPDIQTQKRIVTIIEESLSQLDSAVETLKKTKQQLEIYRQAVLKEAFQGVYTTTWRDENTDESAIKDYQSIDIRIAPFKDVSGDENEINLNVPTEWLYLRIGEVFEVEVGSTPSRQNDKYWNGSINWVSSGEVRFNHIKSTKESISEDGFNNSSTSIQPIGTVMLAMIGEGKTRGQAAILDIQAAHNQNTAAILVSKTPCDPRYVYYFLQLNYNYTRRVGSGNNQKALNKERVRALHFPFASFEEQRIIVNEIECRLSLCDDITKTVNHSLRQAEALRQSILKQAFEVEC